MTRRAGTIMDIYQERQGWTDTSALMLALEYIENQSCNEAFEEFLARAAERETPLYFCHNEDCDLEVIQEGPGPCAMCYEELKGDCP